MRLATQLASAGQDGVTVEYRLGNDRAAAAMVMDALLLVARSGAAVPDPQLAYVIPREDGAEVGKFIVPVPEDRDIEAPEVPLARRLEPGAVWTGRMRLPLPLTPRYPYLRRPPTAAARHVEHLRVVIGFVDLARVEPGRSAFRPYPAAAGLFVPEHGGALRLQELAATTIDLPPPGLSAAW
ncbi:hypothetical protein [Muricoccus radiodurans]|uniref:hypothetical protein n=1 Tax=Muricoccus radiodurans TaxID=2231721 RepID=UPI003CE861BA